MVDLISLVRGGFLRRHRAETLGVAAGISGILKALAAWAVGVQSLISLAGTLSDNWGLITAGLGIATLAAKVGRVQSGNARPKTGVSEIADAALRR